MELKVWVEGAVRVVCGLSLETSCQDVVIALAQAIGQTGRYVLIERLQGTERQLLAHECPLESLTNLGQPANEVQFILRRMGPASSDGPNRPIHPLPKHSTPEPLSKRETKKALSFSLGPSTMHTRTKNNKALPPSPRSSPKTRASPVDSLASSTASLSQSDPCKEEVFRMVLQQQEQLRELEAKLVVLEREAEVWEMRRPATPVPGLTLGLVEDLDMLERRLRQNQAELMNGDNLDEQIKTEEDKEEDLYGRLHQLYTSMDNNSFRLQDLHTISSRLEQELNVEANRQRSWSDASQLDDALEPLKEELHSQLQQAAELETSLSETEKALKTAEEQVQERFQEVEELNKELRQCNLQQFILQGVTPAPSFLDHPLRDQTPPHLHMDTPYLYNTGFLEDDQNDIVTVC